MHQENHRELMDAITHYEDNPGIWTWGGDEEIRAALMDFTRALHNYLAMCESLNALVKEIVGRAQSGDFVLR